MFDSAGTWKHRLQAKAASPTPVTSMDIDPTSSYLVSGYTGGVLRLWDAKTGLQSGGDFSAIHSESVVSVRFVKSPKLCITSCALDGLTQYLEFGPAPLRLGSRLVTAMKGFVGSSLSNIQIGDTVLTAVSSPEGTIKLATVVGSSDGEFLADIKRPADVPACVPCMAFCGKVSVISGKTNRSPVLVVAWMDAVVLFRVWEKGYEPLLWRHSSPVGPISGIGWVGDGMLLGVSNVGVSLIYAGGNNSAGTVLETVSLPKKIVAGKEGIQLVSIRESTGKVHIAYEGGGVGVGWVRKWQDILNALQATEGFIRTIVVAYRMYMGKLKGFAALPEKRVEREKDLKEWLRPAVEAFFIDAASKQQQQLTIQNIRVAIELFTMLEDWDFLFRDLYKRLSDSKAQELFVQALEPFILAGQYRNQTLPPELFGAVLGHYSKEGQEDVLENIILLLNHSKQMLEELSGLCQTFSMYSAYIYICLLENDLLKYEDPLIRMWSLVKYKLVPDTAFTLETLTQKSTRKTAAYMRYKVLWYVDLCLQRKKYQLPDSIASADLPAVVYLILPCLFREGILKDLLLFDPNCTLNVLARLFDSDQLRKIMLGVPDYSSKTMIHPFLYQSFVAELAKLVQSQPLLARKEPSTAYLRFLERISRYPEIAVPSQIYFEGVKQLALWDRESGEEPDEAETHALALLGRLSTLSKEKLQELDKAFEHTNRVDIITFVREKRGEYEKILDTYLEHSPKRIFAWLEGLNRRVVDPEATAKLRLAILDRLDRLVL